MHSFSNFFSFRRKIGELNLHTYNPNSIKWHLIMKLFNVLVPPCLSFWICKIWEGCWSRPNLNKVITALFKDTYRGRMEWQIKTWTRLIKWESVVWLDCTIYANSFKFSLLWKWFQSNTFRSQKMAWEKIIKIMLC